MGGFAQLMQRSREARAQHKEPEAFEGERLDPTAKPMGKPITDPKERDRLLEERFNPDLRKNPEAA